jgi:hypothetical protein
MTSSRPGGSSVGTREGPSSSISHSNHLRSHRRPSTSRRELKERLGRLRRQRLALAVALTTLLALSAVLVSMLQQSREKTVQAEARLQEERAASRARLAHLEAERTETQRSLTLAQEQVAQLVKERLPGLRALELDRTIGIGEHHVRDVTFRRLQSPQKVTYEYKMVVENSSSTAVTPAVKVLLFDRLGVQLGRSQLVATEAEKAPQLRPGEIRTFFSMVELDLDYEPAYFLLAPAAEHPIARKAR